MTAAYKETDVTIRIRPNRYYSAEYRIAVHPTIRPRSEYEANIRYSPSNKVMYNMYYIRRNVNQQLCSTALWKSELNGATHPATSIHHQSWKIPYVARGM